MKPKEAIILAGGLGTRLRRVLNNIPKPMAEVNGKPFLEYLLNYLKDQGINRVILSVGYKWETIRDYFKENWEGIELLYSVEETPLGTGGAIKKSLKLTQEKDIFVLNGDTFFNISLKKLYNLHSIKHSHITIALKFMEDAGRYGTVDIDKDNRIIGFREKIEGQKGFINGGIYIINTDFIASLDFPEAFSFEKDLLEKLYPKYKFYGLPFNEYFIDIGIPQDYEKAKRDFQKF